MKFSLLFVWWLVSCSTAPTQKAPEKTAVVLNGEGRSRLEIKGTQYVCRFSSQYDEEKSFWQLGLTIPFSGEIVWQMDANKPQIAISEFKQMLDEQGLSGKIKADLLVGDILQFLAWKKNKSHELSEVWDAKKEEWVLRSQRPFSQVTRILMRKYNPPYFERVTVEAWAEEPTVQTIPAIRVEIFFTDLKK
jgi:hypothetical protein